MNETLYNKATVAIQRGLQWMKEHEEAILSFKDCNAHYKACYLYAVTGNPYKARQYADMMRERYLRSDGDFRTEENNKGWYNLPCCTANRYIYPNGWIVVALQRIGEYGMAQKGLDFILQMQSPEMGGLCSRFDAATKQIDRRYVDTSSTSSGGLAFLACGKIEEAVRAGDFVVRLLNEQSDPEHYYFSSYIVGKGLQTDVFGDDNQASIRGRKQYCLDLRADPAYELIWLLGKPMKFLSKLYNATGDNRYLDGAMQLYDMFERMPETKYDQLAACKIMWGGAELYRYTQSEKVYRGVKRVLEAICDNQDPCGLWLHTLWFKSLEEQNFAMSMDCVQEMCLELTDAVYDLGWK